MTEAQFWELIHASRQTASDCEAQADALQAILSERTGQDIIEFDAIFFRKRLEAYRWDLWGVAYLINGGCSDDGFEYFRCWLIGQGESAYKQVLADPQSILSLLAGNEELECEALMYASGDAYESLTGEALPVVERDYPEEPIGEPWEEEDLERRFPKVAERYA